MTTQVMRANAEPVPGPIAAAAAHANLGALEGVFTPKKINWFVLVMSMLIGLATLIFVVGLFVLWYLFRTPNLSPRQARKRLYVYQLGFVVANSPDQPQVFRWDDVQTVFQKIVRRTSYGVTVATNYQYTITRRDGATIKITNFWNNVEILGSHINNNVSRALLPGMRAALRNGQGVRFGDIVMTAATVTGKRETVPWSQVKSVTVNSGYVRVNLANKFFSLSTKPAAAIPNLPLFLTIAEELRMSAAQS
jgi:hypothetical protein